MSTCRFTSTTTPRVLKGRHGDECPGDECRGCQPCPERHCQVCGVSHVTVDGRGSDETCAGCLSETRDDLGAIVELSGHTLAEAVHKGVDSEAAMLAGRAIDTPEGIEAWNHRAMSAAMGRIPELDVTDERHPLWVLGTWEMLIREHLDQPSEARITVWRAADYLGGHLTRLAHDPEFAFDELARDLRRCRGHLEVVLHDGEQVEHGAPCLKCETVRLHRIYRGRELPWSSKDEPRHAMEDGWACPRCRGWSNPDQYRLAVTNEHRERANWLTDADMEARTRVPAATVRSWARSTGDGSKPRVRKRRDSERTVYSVEDVIRERDERARLAG